MSRSPFSFPEISRRDLLRRRDVRRRSQAAAALPSPLFAQAAAALPRLQLRANRKGRFSDLSSNFPAATMV